MVFFVFLGHLRQHSNRTFAILFFGFRCLSLPTCVQEAQVHSVEARTLSSISALGKGYLGSFAGQAKPSLSRQSVTKLASCFLETNMPIPYYLPASRSRAMVASWGALVEHLGTSWELPGDMGNIISWTPRTTSQHKYVPSLLLPLPFPLSPA